MKFSCVKVIIFNGFIFSFLLAIPFDSGFIEWQQPNGVTFTARAWGDEFEMWMETQDSYRFVQGVDGYYYYAVLGANGDFVPSTNKVGIDAPFAESYQLQRSGVKQQEIADRQAEFEEELRQNAEWYRQKREAANGGTVAVKVGVILVDFATSRKYKSEPGGEFPHGYKKEFFDNLIFSQDIWIGEPGPNSPHPEEKEVFGSMRDYYNQQSRGLLDIIGKNDQPVILNPIDPAYPGEYVPQWIQLPGDFEDYNCGNYSYGDFIRHADSVFQETFTNINLSDYESFIYVYGGTWGLGNLSPKNVGHKSIVGEQFPDFNPFFSHIGVYCHEFGHQLGAADEYKGNSNFDSWHWSLMSRGGYNGNEADPAISGPLPLDMACPAVFSPYYKFLWEWVDPIYLSNPSYTDFEIIYNYDNPLYYRIDIIDSDEFFVLENRLKDNFDLYTPVEPEYDPNDPLHDPNGNEGGLLIWHIDPTDYQDYEGIECANNEFHTNPPETQVGHPFPYVQGDPNNSGENFNDNTTPSSNLRDGTTSSGISIDNIRWISGTQKTLVNIIHDYGNNIIIYENATWSGTQEINQNVYVMGGATLTVLPGTTVNFGAGLKLTLMAGGRLVTIGSQTQPILFQPMVSGNKWGGLVIADETAEIEAAYMTIREAQKGFFFEKRLNFNIEQISFQDNLKSIDVANVAGSATLNISNCSFTSSPLTYFNTNSGVVVFNFTNCFFQSSSLIFTNPTSMNFKSNTLIDNSTINRTNNSGTLIVENNIFYNFTSGSFVTSPTVDNTTIRYNCLYPITPSQNLSFFDQPGNFSADPQFVNPQGPQPDYHLQETSPCIDAGDPLADYSREPGNNGGRVNIGLYGNTPEATQTNPFNPPAWENEIVFLGDFSGTGNINAVPGLTAKSANNKQIKIKGILNAYGNLSSGITFTNYNAGGQWKGLYADAGSQINFDYCVIENSTKGLFNDFQSEPAILPNLSVANSIIQNNETGSELFYSGLEFQDNTYSNNSSVAFYANLCQGTFSGNHLESNGKGLDLNRCQLIVSGNIISDNDAVGLFLSWDQGSTLDNNTIENNGYVPTDLPWSERSGITLYRSSPLLWENTIRNNRGNGLLAFASSIPVLNAKDEANLNLVKNNGTDPAQVQFPYESSELYFHDYAQPQMANGHNDIIDESNINEDNFLFYLEPEDGAEISINISGNYWGMDERNFDYDRFYPLDILIIDPYDEEPNVQGGFAKTGSNSGAGGVNRYSFGKTGAISLLDSLFHHAVVLEDSGLFGEAYNRFFSILQSYPDSAVSYSSLPRLIRCGLKSGISTQDLKNTLHDLQSASSYPYILKQTPAFINECEIVDEEFSVVINNLNQLLANSIPTIDSLYAELDLSAVQLLTGQTGSSKANSLNGITGIAAFSSFRDHILEQVLNRASASEAIAEIPATFALSQNYPNPFNPTTTIRYQLPKPAWVRLEIYNILGQKIKTLIDARQSADFYAVPWDGTNHAGSQVASGMYVYRLAAEPEKKGEKFVMVKKMLLIR
ncbi:MAG: hypothetical protein CV087_21610 [Candidatus Brocadia sp. WS118]|nr:MAG: hypothetical protein CV087_21610 [Candidatus Brocadia sp. WS118]